jgi:hypothetical protein
MTFPVYVTPRRIDPTLPDLAARVFASSLSHDRLSAIWGDNPRVRPADAGLQLSGAKALDPSNVATVSGDISGVKGRFFLSTSEGGDSSVA